MRIERSIEEDLEVGSCYNTRKVYWTNQCTTCSVETVVQEARQPEKKFSPMRVKSGL